MEFRRREVLAGTALALAGCTDLRTYAEGVVPPSGHPLEGTNTVAVVNNSASDLDLEALTDEALAFWNQHAEQYAGFAGEFRRVQTDPDVEIEFLDSHDDLDGCTQYHSGTVLGCAPLVTEGSRIPRPVIAEVVATDRPYGAVLTTTQHEIGHLLGLGHDDEPAYIMSNRLEDRLPLYENRIAVRDAFQAAWNERNEGTSDYNDGAAHWNAEEYEAAVEPFDRAADHYRAILDHVADAEAAADFDGMERPDTVDQERLAQYFETTRTAANLLVDAATNMREAAEAMVDGDRSRASDRQEAANAALTDLQALDVPTPLDVARALGLIRDEEVTTSEPNET